ncbi:hypothetical protein VCHC17A1_4016B, partial [Vibrio cholerae HC-17A1]
LHAEPLDSYFR